MLTFVYFHFENFSFQSLAAILKVQCEEKFNKKKLGDALHLQLLVNAWSYLTIDFFLIFTDSDIHFYGIEVEFP